AVRATGHGAEQGIAIDCAIRRDAPCGVLDGALRLATGNPAQPELAIPVRAFVQPSAQVAPTRLAFPRGDASALRQLKVTSALPVEILGVEVATTDGSPAPLQADAVGGLSVNVRGAPGPDPLAGTCGDVLIFL